MNIFGGTGLCQPSRWHSWPRLTCRAFLSGCRFRPASMKSGCAVRARNGFCCPAPHPATAPCLPRQCRARGTRSGADRHATSGAARSADSTASSQDHSPVLIFPNWAIWRTWLARRVITLAWLEHIHRRAACIACSYRPTLAVPQRLLRSLHVGGKLRVHASGSGVELQPGLVLIRLGIIRAKESQDRPAAPCEGCVDVTRVLRIGLG